MVGAPLTFQLHTVAAMLLIGIVPVTRLVHVFSVPVGYLSRPYLVYRSRDPESTAGRKPQRGWEPIQYR
jgi:nitrate reductase gamma subunit